MFIILFVAPSTIPWHFKLKFSVWNSHLNLRSKSGHSDRKDRKVRRSSSRSPFALHTRHLRRVLRVLSQGTKNTEHQQRRMSKTVTTYFLKHGSSFLISEVIALHPSLRPILCDSLRSIIFEVVESDDKHVLKRCPNIWPIPLLAWKNENR